VPTLTMYQVDAFAERAFQGNPAAVLILQDWLADDVMQAIANENNLAETAFARPNGKGWDLRWFTPVHEVDFCGHATLATAHVLASQHNVAHDMAFATRVGELRVSQRQGAYPTAARR
jgi:PhzF family phenazine biosynthesis protein